MGFKASRFLKNTIFVPPQYFSSKNNKLESVQRS